jgi:hypothetical protein
MSAFDLVLDIAGALGSPVHAVVRAAWRRICSTWLSRRRAVDAERFPPPGMLKPPLVFDDHGDIRVFGSIADALAYAETVDVEAGTHEAFDSAGSRLTFEMRDDGRHPGKRVAIANVDTAPAHSHRLRLRLVRFIERTGKRTDPDSCLEDLIRTVSDRQGQA